MNIYTKRQFSGNVNGWNSPKEVGTVPLDEGTAELLNEQFGNSGIDYVLVTEEAPEAEVQAETAAPEASEETPAAK